MDRDEFYDKLQTVAPALSDSDLIPVLRHFWFTGDALMAFNDHIAISIPFPTEFKGAVPGDSLLSLVGNCIPTGKNKEVVMTVNDNHLHIKIWRTKMDLPLLEPDNFIFEMPQLKQATQFPVDGETFCAAIKQCMLSVSTDTSVPDQLGITLIPDNSRLLLFSTDNSTLTHSHVKLTKAVTIKRVILPTMFCEQLERFGNGKELQLEIFEDHAMFRAGDVTVFGRLIASPRPLDFVNIFERNVPEANRKKLVSIPSRLKLALERAVVITESRVDRTKTELKIEDQRLKLQSKSAARGSVDDVITLKETHDDVSIMVNPVLLKNGYPHFEKMLFTDRCAIMTKDKTTYLIATTD
jgi:DNA polymerase III sliding clamp (beta) subunit (PCNA family)